MADALGPLTVLQQLTALRLELVGRQQLGLLQMPQLRELYVGLDRRDRSSTAPLQLGRLSSVSRLWVHDGAGWLQFYEQLPPNVVDLWWYNEAASCSAAGDWSMQPLLRLSCLRKLQLRSVTMLGMLPSAIAPEVTRQSAAELARLSTLSSLQEMELDYHWHDSLASVDASTAETSAAAAALSAAWQVLPVTSLALSCVCIPVSVLQQALPLQGLSSLQLASPPGWFVQQRLPPDALTHLLQRATALQQLQLMCQLECSTLPIPQGLGGGQLGAADAERVGGIARLLGAVCSLPALEVASVRLGVQLSDAAVARLSSKLQQQLPSMQQYYSVGPDIVSLQF
jgi:hypothetical protein